jgi:hypothetical protein
MTRLRYAFDEARVQRFQAEGRGQGFGPKYKPWLQIQDVPSTGRSHRPYGIKSQRVHHLLSDGEWKCFLRLEVDPDIDEIQEQKPMDRIATFRIARDIGVKHPLTLDGTPYVMTLDFVVTKRVEGRPRLLPYTFKYDPETMTPRQQELMAITREFCKRQGEELRTIDQQFFDRAFTLNYDSVRAYHNISELSFFQETDVTGITCALVNEAASESDETLLRTCRGLAGEFRTSPTVVHQIAMHLVSRGTLRVDLSSPTGLERLPMSAYTVVSRVIGAKTAV